MTAEIVLMNRTGAVIAADRAATSIISGAPHITEAQKVFCLPKPHSALIAVYGMADLNGHEWRVLADTFMETLPDKPLPKLEDYANAFFSYLAGERNLFPADAQRTHFLNFLGFLYSSVRHEANVLLHVLKETSTQNVTADGTLKHIIAQLHEAVLRGGEDERPHFAPGYSEKDATRILKENAEHFDKLIARQFAGTGIVRDQKFVQALREIAAFLPIVETIVEPYSGIVFMGYGAEERYPACQEYRATFVFDNHLKRHSAYSAAIDPSERHGDMAFFADTLWTESFVLGVSGEMMSFYSGFGHYFMEEYSGEILDKLNVGGADRKKVQPFMEEHLAPMVFGAADQALMHYIHEERISPLLGIVSVGNQQSLVNLAQELLALNNFGKRLINEAETVSKSIDVAVVTKSGGAVAHNPS